MNGRINSALMAFIGSSLGAGAKLLFFIASAKDLVGFSDGVVPSQRTSVEI